ncbi:MAG: DUF922 domain-containing protein [Pseudomonadota bacterium]
MLAPPRAFAKALLERCGTLKARNSMLVAAGLVMAGCQMTASNKVSVDYYAISGNSTAALDRQIKEKGPRIGDGRHAVAVARIRMIPNIRYKRANGMCRTRSAKVAVNARITLPRWTSREYSSAAVGQAWDNIERYTRLHEAVHVAIAFRYAKETEQELMEAAPQPTCNEMRSLAAQIVAKQLELHDKAQKRFDAQEQQRFAEIAKRQAKSGDRRGARGLSSNFRPDFRPPSTRNQVSPKLPKF